MSDVFEKVVSKYKGTPSSVVLFLASFAMLVIGINHFVEDLYSSYIGLISIEQHFHLNVQMWEWTYWTMSASLQVATVVFFYIWLADTNKRWAWLISLGAQVADFLSDLWFRSNGSMFSDWGATLVGAVITFAFFTIGSEMFISFGFGLCLKLAAPALHQWRIFRNSMEKAKKAQTEDFRENQTESGRYRGNFRPSEEKGKVSGFKFFNGDQNKHDRR